MILDQPLSSFIPNKQRTGNRSGGRINNSNGGARRSDLSRAPYNNRVTGSRNNISNTSRRSLGECKFFNTPEGCVAPNCGFTHSLIPGVSYCQFFNTPEGCRRGRSCGFIHSLGNNNSFANQRQPSQRSQTRRNNPQPRNNTEQPRIKALCHFFNSKEGCKAGDACGFIHKEIKPGQTVCHFYGTEKGCMAENCGFLHQ